MYLNRKLIIYLSVAVIVTAIIAVLYVTYNKRQCIMELYENNKICSLESYFTLNGKYSSDENDADYWLKQQSSNEQQLYSTLLEEANNAETNNNLSDASVIRNNIAELQSIRVAMRKKALESLEGSMQERERGLDSIPKPNSCTVKKIPMKIFEISGGTCSIGTVIGGKENVYTYSDILKPTKPDNIFTQDGIESCYLTIPENTPNDVALVMVLNVLDAIGEKLDSVILNKIDKLTKDALSLAKRSDFMKNVTIPKSREELLQSINDFNQSNVNLREMMRRNRLINKNNKFIEDANRKLNIEIDDIVEIYEDCNNQGKRYVLPMGMTLFTGENEKLIGVSSINFNDRKGIYVVMYDRDFNPYTIRSSVSCLTNVNIGGKNSVSLNDNVVAIEVLKSTKHPSGSMIASGANQKIVLDVAGWSTNNMADIFGWSMHGGTNQKWTYNPRTKNLVSSHSRKCLDAAYAGTDNFTKIIQYDCHNGNNMKWDFLPSGQIRNVNANKCLQVDPQNSDNNGVNMYLYDCDGNSQFQKWSVVDDLGHMRKKTAPPPPPKTIPNPIPTPIPTPTPTSTQTVAPTPISTPSQSPITQWKRRRNRR